MREHLVPQPRPVREGLGVPGIVSAVAGSAGTRAGNVANLLPPQPARVPAPPADGIGAEAPPTADEEVWEAPVEAEAAPGLAMVEDEAGGEDGGGSGEPPHEGGKRGRRH